MRKLLVGNLVMRSLLDLFEARKLLMELVGYGWIICIALEVNELWLIVVIMDGEDITAVITKMQELNVHQVTIFKKILISFSERRRRCTGMSQFNLLCLSYRIIIIISSFNQTRKKRKKDYTANN